MVNTALRIAALIIIIVMIASIGVYATISLRSRPRTPQTSTRITSSFKGGTVYSTTITNGTRFDYLWSLSYINSSLKKPKVSNMTVIMKVVGIEGPWIKVNMTISNETEVVNYPYGSLLMPKELLGKKEVNLPLYIGLGRSCITLKLQGEDVINGKGAYVYVGSINQLGYNVKIKAYYDTESGILLKMVSYLEVFPFTNVLVKGNITMKLRGIHKGAGQTLKIILPKSFMCLNSVSSDLRLTATGLYEIVNGTVEDVSDIKLKNALNTFALVAVLDKECPHCQRFWPVLLEAANATDTDVYVVIISNSEVMTQAIYNIAYEDVMGPLIKQQKFGVPFLGVYKNGTLVTYRLGEQTLDDAENFLINAETHIAK
jgi:hypothetical protein